MLLKRRLAVLWAAAIVLLTVLACGGIALAITKTCSSSPCYGTRHNDTLTEQRVDDKIYGLRGDDTLRAGLLRESPPDTDILHGNKGSDRLESDDLDVRDVLYGGKGHDVCIIDKRIGDGSDRSRGCEMVKRVRSIIVD